MTSLSEMGDLTPNNFLTTTTEVINMNSKSVIDKLFNPLKSNNLKMN